MATIPSTVVPSALLPFVVVILAVAVHSSLAGAELSDVPSRKSSSVNDAEDGGGAVTWGLPDAVAPVGKLFEYRLNRDGEVGATADDNAYVGFGLGVDGSGDVAGKKPDETAWAVFQVSCNLVRIWEYEFSGDRHNKHYRHQTVQNGSNNTLMNNKLV